MEKYSGVKDLSRLIPEFLDLEVTLTGRRLLELVERGSGIPRILSTTQAASVFGYTSKTWRRRCEDRKLPGAFRDECGRWRIPREDAERFIAKQRDRNGVFRGPRKKGPAGAPSQAR